MGHASEVSSVGAVFPNNCRAAWTTAETGFQSAIALSTGGKLLVGTNVFAMNVSGEITTKLALLTTSGVRTSSPTRAITQEMAKANSSRSRKAASASPADEWIRQPTTSPVT